MINLKKLGTMETSETRRKEIIMRTTMLLMMVCMFLSDTAIAFADSGTNYGENAGKWFLNQFFWIYVALVMVGVGLAAVKKAYAGAVITFAVGTVVGYLIKNPTKIETIGSTLGSTIGF